MALQLGYPADQTLPALARAMIDDGDAKELVTEFGDTKLDSADAQAALKTTIGNALVSLNKPKEAEAAFTAALAAKADFADALLGIATLRAGSGDLEGSKKLVDTILAQPHAPPEASLLQAELLNAEGQSDRARAVLEKLAEARPDYLPAHYGLASLLIGQRRSRAGERTGCRHSESIEAGWARILLRGAHCIAARGPCGRSRGDPTGLEGRASTCS